MQDLVLSLHGVGVSFARPVLRDVDLCLRPGWTGLVGANGAGKTTLLRVIAGELAPDDGSVRAPPGAVIAVCPQEVGPLTDDVRAFADARTELHGRLALGVDDVERWPTLSPGERKRWQIGAALVREPDVLLLDEPTNHLDEGARRLLVRALRAFRGIGVLVSHDRELLDELPERIVRVQNASIAVYAGGYTDASRAWTGERRAAEEAHAAARQRAKALAARLDDARREQAAAERSRSSRARMKDKNDHDARGSLAKGMAAFAEARAGRTTAVVRSELERAEKAIPRIERDVTVGGAIFARFERAPSPVLLHARGVTIGREDRVRIAGPNGAGKTTLIRALLERARRDRILYLPQELEPEDVQAFVDRLRALDPESRGRVLAVFAALGSDPDRVAHRADAELSPGEARKLALALGLGDNAWALVLDEPTNHLDLPTIERLERALEGYPGAVVLVTHDDRFAEAITDRTIAFDPAP